VVPQTGCFLIPLFPFNFGIGISQLHIIVPIVLTVVYAFLSIRFEGTSVLDFIKNAFSFFIGTPQTYVWRMQN
jgi:hypothetical protein